MKYKITISLRAQEEIEEAIDYYLSSGTKAHLHLINELSSIYKTLASNPYFEIRYKNIRSVKIRKFPYSLFFIINDDKTVHVLSCFHNKRNPGNRPDY